MTKELIGLNGQWVPEHGITDTLPKKVGLSGTTKPVSSNLGIMFKPRKRASMTYVWRERS